MPPDPPSGKGAFGPFYCRSRLLYLQQPLVQKLIETLVKFGGINMLFFSCFALVNAQNQDLVVKNNQFLHFRSSLSGVIVNKKVTFARVLSVIDALRDAQ